MITATMIGWGVVGVIVGIFGGIIVASYLMKKRIKRLHLRLDKITKEVRNNEKTTKETFADTRLIREAEQVTTNAEPIEQIGSGDGDVKPEVIQTAEPSQPRVNPKKVRRFRRKSKRLRDR